MPAQSLDVKGLKPTHGFTQVRIGTGSKLVAIAGQVGYAQDSFEVHDGHRAQARQAVENVALALQTAGARPEDLMRITMYVVGLNDETQTEAYEGYLEGLEKTGLPPVALAMMGISRLGGDEYLIELEATAITD
jgi:enamine deaminase RidA (YjgF/YER057c/UK114 family)